MGQMNRSAIGTLVERTTRYVVLLHLPNGHGPDYVRKALVSSITLTSAPVPLAYLGPGHRDVPPQRLHCRHQRPGLLL
jgi:hypothetical protein